MPGVDVRLADYGVSQFSTPSGLWRQRGTEEYMAPELRGNHLHHTAYDDKVIHVCKYAYVKVETLEATSTESL